MTPQQQPATFGLLEDKVIARIDPSRSARIETQEYVIHRDPRISATKLGEYLVANPSAQKTIIKNQKKAKKAIILYHSKTKLAFQGAFSESGLDRDYLMRKATALRDASGETDWERTDNKLSAIALESLSELAPEIETKNITKLRRPNSGWGGIVINGVKVSIDPAVIFTVRHRQVTKLGAVILYTTKDDSKSLSKQLNGNCAGDYVGAILLKLLEQKFSETGVPLPSRCLTVDVFRKKVHQAPKSFKTLIQHVEDACEMINLRWDKIEV